MHPPLKRQDSRAFVELTGLGSVFPRWKLEETVNSSGKERAAEEFWTGIKAEKILELYQIYR